MCQGYPNITFIGPVEGKELEDYHGKCIATLYLSRKEDFGMSPVESMAAGKPCIAVNEGGLKETVIHKKTGYLIEPGDVYNIDNIIAAINYISPQKAKKMRKACEKRAKEFSEEKYIKGIIKSIT